MAMRRDLLDPTIPANLQPEQRQREVAAILAAGVIRMRQNGRGRPRPIAPRARTCDAPHSVAPVAPACMSQILPESGETRLELSRDGCPDGQRD